MIKQDIDYRESQKKTGHYNLGAKYNFEFVV